MITIFHSLILGIVEGFTEFLPISSTAHLTLTAELLGLDQSVFVKTFEIAIQSGAVFAIIILYWKKFTDIEILKRIAIAFIPTGIIGFILYKLAKQYIIGNVSIVLWALVIGGIVLILFEKYSTKGLNGDAATINSSAYMSDTVVTRGASNLAAGVDIKSLSYARLVWIGVIQTIAIVPGVSRSAATIIGGRLLGLSRDAVVEFSFLLAVPTILAATGLDLVKNIHLFTPDQFGVLAVGFLASLVTAVVGIKFLLKYIRTHSFVGFGIYRIVIAVLFLLFVAY